MNQIFHFVREKAFVLILLGSIFAVAVTGVWAIQTVRQNLNLSPQDNTQEQDDFNGFTQSELGGDALWDEPANLVTDEMNGEITMDEDAASKDAISKPTAGQSVPTTPSASSTASSGVSSSSEHSEASVILEPQDVTVTPSFVLPVTGLVSRQFSGNELVFNETLGDWRTHNGVDYGAALGEAVICPVEGDIITITTDGNWGGVIEIKDAQDNIWRFCGVEYSDFAVDNHVTVGQEIGSIGLISAESADDPHLHLEIIAPDGTYQDPTLFLK